MSSYPARVFTRRSQPDQGGFTLVEIMVGLVIGMLATLVIMQVFSVFENQKRTTTGSADALTNGNIALFKIARDAQMAGYSLVSTTDSPIYSCSTFTTAESGVTGIFPVSVTDNVDGTTSDSITLRYGTTQTGGIPSSITATGPTTVASSFGCSVGNKTLVVNGSACNISHATAVTPSAGSLPGTVTMADESIVAANSSTLACLTNWREVTYKVINGNTLAFRDNLATSPDAFNPLVSGIVNIQVQYGISSAATSAAVVAWVEPTGSYATPAVAYRNLIKAVRIAVVARDAKQDINDVTSFCNQTTFTGLCAWQDVTGSQAPAIDLTGTANWKKYRYRVFETTIPLRNLIWNY
jgi:type IV pilus assembly protein PilW